MKPDNYKQFTEVSYSGRKLLEKHSLSEHGVWQIFGEDPNCDWGGYHHEPELGFAEGTLEEVIRYAVELPRFWQWGAGGRIVKQSPPKAIKVSELAKNQARIKEIDKQLAALQAEKKRLQDA